MEFFWIDGPSTGRLAIATRPRGGEWLADDICGAAKEKIDTIVSMLTAAENAELGLLDERWVVEAAELQFFSVPIEDRGVPERAMPFLEAVGRAVAQIKQGRSVIAHCRMGIGRSSMFAAATLVKLGIPADRAWEKIAAARGRSVPDVPAQRTWIVDMTALLMK